MEEPAIFEAEPVEGRGGLEVQASRTTLAFQGRELQAIDWQPAGLASSAD
jgi:hypothetical protein